MPAHYAVPDALVSTEWLARHLTGVSVRIVEADLNTAAYDQGHIPGAVGWNWRTQLCDTVIRDIVPRASWEELLGSSGIDNDTTVILYGHTNNWFATWAFWQLKVYGHRDVRLLDGGRKKWLAEKRQLTPDTPRLVAKTYTARAPDLSIRAFLPEVQAAVLQKQAVLVDVRSEREFTGEILAPFGSPETCQRGGHIPGARNVPSGRECNEDGTFRSADDLRQLYRSAGVMPEEPIIVYCRIGERSSHMWFVLRYLLGYPNVKNYDGSWTEWGNLVGAPIEKT
jgi:thiosulfate/3-mercaptopyruvate sulfurtransferase